MKFATGGPMQVAERPRPAKVTEVGARARPIGLGLMPVTHNGHGRVSFTVSVMLPTSAQFPAPVWLYTCTCTVPAASPGSGWYILVAFVGNSTVNVVVPVSCVARACPPRVPPLNKFATGEPKP